MVMIVNPLPGSDYYNYCIDNDLLDGINFDMMTYSNELVKSKIVPDKGFEKLARSLIK